VLQNVNGRFAARDARRRRPYTRAFFISGARVDADSSCSSRSTIDDLLGR